MIAEHRLKRGVTLEFRNLRSLKARVTSPRRATSNRSS